MFTTTTTTRDRGDRYGPVEWAQSIYTVALVRRVGDLPTSHSTVRQTDRQLLGEPDAAEGGAIDERRSRTTVKFVRPMQLM